MYRCWLEIRRRCVDPTRQNYERYGGRGIRVCDEWERSFDAFSTHIGPKPSPEHSIDRIDNNRGYEPGNVRWATREQQSYNRRNTVHVERNGRRMPASFAADEASLPRDRVRRRVKAGRPPFQPLREPITVTSDGRTGTLLQWSKWSGMSIRMLYKRYDAGHRGSDIVSKPPRGDGYSFIVNGEPYTLASASDAFGIPVRTLYDAHWRGDDVAEYISTRLTKSLGHGGRSVRSKCHA